MDKNNTQSPKQLLATPAGAYFAVSSGENDPLRTALFQLLAQPFTWAAPEREAPAKPVVSEITPENATEQLLQLGWASAALHDEVAQTTESLERLLPEMLAALSGEGQALLADHQGLQMAVAGFDEHQAQGLAALSSEAIALGLRHHKLMQSSAAKTPTAWAMVDAAGNSQLGVWPLHIGQRWFALVVRGRPLFARPAFLRLVRTLVRREALAAKVSQPSSRRPGGAF